MSKIKKFVVVFTIILLIVISLYFHYPYTQINSDLTIWMEEGQYVGCTIFYPDGKVHISQKPLEKDVTEKYQEILQDVSNIRILPKYQLIRPQPIIAVVFTPMQTAPHRLQFTQYYYMEKGYFCTCDNYAEIYDKLLTLTQDYLKNGSEIIDL